METLATHYARLLGTDDSWRVEAVDLRLEDRQVKIRLKHVGSGIACLNVAVHVAWPIMPMNGVGDTSTPCSSRRSWWPDFLDAAARNTE